MTEPVDKAINTYINHPWPTKYTTVYVTFESQN